MTLLLLHASIILLHQIHISTTFQISGGLAVPSTHENDVRAEHMEDTLNIAQFHHAPEGVFRLVNPDKSRNTDPFKSEDAIRNFSEAGLCFATSMEGVVKENWRLIESDFQRGLKRAANTKILFTGLIRNAEASVQMSYRALLWLALKFKDYHFLVYENDSKDKTPDNLRRISAVDSKYEVRTNVFHMRDDRQLQDSRLRRMAFLRNNLHTWIAEFLQKSPDWDLILMYDFDLNEFGWDSFSPHSFFATLGRKESMEDKWDMMCANGLRHYLQKPEEPIGFHDCFAFRAEGYSKSTPESVGSQRRLLRLSLAKQIFRANCYANLSKQLFAQYDLIPVESFYGGLAFYKPRNYLQCQYDSNVTDCEHVAFHKCMRDRGSKGRMFMDPLLNTIYDPYISHTCFASAGLETVQPVALNSATRSEQRAPANEHHA